MGGCGVSVDQEESVCASIGCSVGTDGRVRARHGDRVLSSQDILAQYLVGATLGKGRACRCALSHAAFRNSRPSPGKKTVYSIALPSVCGGNRRGFRDTPVNPRMLCGEGDTSFRNFRDDDGIKEPVDD